MSYTKEIIYISSIKWNYSWHRQQEMMTKMAELGYKILYIEPAATNGTGDIIQVSDNIWIHQPKGVPYERCSYVLNCINERLSRKAICEAAKKLSFTNPIYWIDRVHGFDYKYFSKMGITIYDLVDETLAFGRVRNEKMLIRKENAVLNNSDLVISSSNTLLQRKLKQSNREGKSIFVPNGVEIRRFITNKTNEQVDQCGHPIAGFVGTVSDRSINFTLLNQVAQKCKNWSFVFVGPGSEIGKERIIAPNVFFLDAIPGYRIPEVINTFDVGIIPYNTSGSKIDYVFPRKACEYLAAGKPVVGTDLPELSYLQPYVDIVHDVDEFALCLRHACGHFSPEERIRFVKMYSWDYIMSELIREINILTSKDCFLL